jgi:intein-encoded DNA endonuclease-like protein
LPAEIQLQIRDWFVGRPDDGFPRLTYEQISAALAEEGYQISKSQIHRWIARQRNELERIETARERARMLAKYLVPDGIDIEQAGVVLAGALCVEALADADLQQVKSIEDLAKVANSLGRLQTSAVMRDKWEQERSKRIEAAVKQLKQEVMAALEGQPELTSKLLDVIEAAQKQMVEKTA